jgi:hypothetical protein
MSGALTSVLLRLTDRFMPPTSMSNNWCVSALDSTEMPVPATTSGRTGRNELWRCYESVVCIPVRDVDLM